MSDIFVSYARKDNQPPPDGNGFVTQLNEALKSKGFTVWMDKQDIIPAGRFEDDIKKGILEADAFLLVISSHSLNPESFCAREIEYALERNKRLIPLIRSEKDKEGKSLSIPSAFSKLDWIFAREGDNFDDAVDKIERVLRTGDQEYIHSHSRLLARAEQWDSRGRTNGFLLRRGDLKDAEGWHRQSARTVEGHLIEPRPTDLQIDYLQASQRAARAFQRLVSAISLIGLIVMSLLAVAAVVNAGLANRRALESHSLALAANAEVASGRDGELALALAIEANTMPDPPSVSQAILSRYAYLGGELVTRLIAKSDSSAVSNDAMTAIAYSHDGHFFAIGMHSGAISLWDAQTLKRIKQFPPQEQRITSLAFSPDGERLLSGGGKNLADTGEQTIELRLWTLVNESYILLQGHSSSISTVAFTPDGATAISIENRGIVHAWDGITGASRWSADTVGKSAFVSDFTSGAISTDGLSIYVTKNLTNDIIVLDLATGKQAGTTTLDIPTNNQTQGCYKILPHPDGRRLLCIGSPVNNPSAYLVDLKDGKLLVRYQPIESNIFDVAFSQIGDQFVTADTNSLRLWETDTGRNIHTYLTNAPQSSVGYSPDGKYIVTNLGGDVGIWDGTLQNGALDGTIWKKPTFFKAAYDGSRSAFWVADSGHVSLIDETDGGVRTEFDTVSPVSAMAVMPDGGALIATFSRDLTRRSADSLYSGGSPLWTAVTGDDSLLTIAIDSTGSHAVTTYNNSGKVILWDTATGQRLHEFDDISVGASAAFLAPDGSLVGAIGCVSEDNAKNCTDNRFIVWDVVTGKVRYSLPSAGGGLTVSSNGKLWAVMGDGFDILLVDIQTGSIVHALYPQNHYAKALAFSADGTRLISSSFLNNEAIDVWDVASGQEIRQIVVNSAVWELFFSSSRNYFFSLDFPNSIGATQLSLNRWRVDDSLSGLLDWTQRNRAWRTFTCSERVRFNILPLCDDIIRSHGDSIQAEVVQQSTPFPTVPIQSSRTPYPRTATPTATATATPTITPTAAPHVYRALYDVQWSPDGTRTLAGEESGFIVVWNVATRTELYRLRGHDTRTAFQGARARWSPDGSRIASYSAQNNALIWDSNTGKLLYTLTGHNDDIVTMNWSPDGRQIVSASLDGTARIWDTETGELVTVFKGHNAALETVAFSPDGKFVASGADDGTARVWDATTGVEVWNFGERIESTYTNFTKEAVQIYAVSWSHDSGQLIAAGSDGAAIGWDTKTGTRLFSLEYPQTTGNLNDGTNSVNDSLKTNWIFNVYWSPDETRLLLHTFFMAPSVWDAHTNKELFELPGHPDVIVRALWSPDGKRILTAGTDGTIRIWDAIVGAQTLRMDHRATVSSASWSPNGNVIASSGVNGTIRLWDSLTGLEIPFLSEPAQGVTAQVTNVIGNASNQLQMTIEPTLELMMTLEAVMTQNAGS